MPLNRIWNLDERFFGVREHAKYQQQATIPKGYTDEHLLYLFLQRKLNEGKLVL